MHVFMARRAITMIAFPRVRTIYIYIFLCHLREYALLRKLHHTWRLGQLMGVAGKRTRDQGSLKGKESR